MAKPCPECARTVKGLKKIRADLRDVRQRWDHQLRVATAWRIAYDEMERKLDKTRKELRRVRMANRPNAEVWAQTMAVLLAQPQPQTATDVGRLLGISAQAAYGRLTRLHRAVMVVKKTEGRYGNERVLFSPSQKGRKRFALPDVAVGEKPKPADHLPDVARRQRRSI